MKKVFLVYKTDRWHSYSSRDTIGVATSVSIAIRLCEEQAKKEGNKIDREQLFNLKNLKQTQGYSGESEFHFESMEVDKLL